MISLKILKALSQVLLWSDLVSLAFGRASGLGNLTRSDQGTRSPVSCSGQLFWNQAFQKPYLSKSAWQNLENLQRAFCFSPAIDSSAPRPESSPSPPPSHPSSSSHLSAFHSFLSVLHKCPFSSLLTYSKAQNTFSLHFSRGAVTFYPISLQSDCLGREKHIFFPSYKKWFWLNNLLHHWQNLGEVKLHLILAWPRWVLYTLYYLSEFTRKLFQLSKWSKSLLQKNVFKEQVDWVVSAKRLAATDWHCQLARDSLFSDASQPAHKQNQDTDWGREIWHFMYFSGNRSLHENAKICICKNSHLNF